MAIEEPPIVLNVHQRRHFQILLAQLEVMLVRVEDALDRSTDVRLQGSRVADDLPESFANRARPILRSLRLRVTDLGRRLAVPPEVTSAARTLVAELTVAAVRLEDSLSRSLRGYGEVHPSVQARLDPVLLELAGDLSELAKLLTGPRHSSRQP